MDLNALPEGAGWTGLGAALTGIAVGLRRLLRQEKVEGSKSQAEISLLETLQKERDEYRLRFEQLMQARLEDTKRIGELTNKVEHLTQVNAEMLNTVQAARQEVHALRGQLETLAGEYELLKQSL